LIPFCVILVIVPPVAKGAIKPKGNHPESASSYHSGVCVVVLNLTIPGLDPTSVGLSAVVPRGNLKNPLSLIVVSFNCATI
jgi:hypothetical protein